MDLGAYPNVDAWLAQTLVSATLRAVHGLPDRRQLNRPTLQQSLVNPGSFDLSLAQPGEDAQRVAIVRRAQSGQAIAN